MFSKLKILRRIAMRYDKIRASYLGFDTLTSIKVITHPLAKRALA